MMFCFFGCDFSHSLSNRIMPVIAKTNAVFENVGIISSWASKTENSRRNMRRLFFFDASKLINKEQQAIK